MTPRESNKGDSFRSSTPALAMQIVLEIESHFSAVCSDCIEEYSVELKSPESPALRWFLCFQGSHNCQQSTNQVATLFKKLYPPDCLFGHA